MLQKNIHEGGFLSTPHCIYSKPRSQGLSFALPLTEEENHENKAGFSVKMRNPFVRRCTDISACNSIKNILGTRLLTFATEIFKN